MVSGFNVFTPGGFNASTPGGTHEPGYGAVAETPGCDKKYGFQAGVVYTPGSTNTPGSESVIKEFTQKGELPTRGKGSNGLGTVTKILGFGGGAGGS